MYSEHAATVDAALEILELLAASKDAVSLSALSRKTGMYKSRVARLVRSLERGGLATRAFSDRRYLLGPKLITLGQAAQLQLSVLTQAQPIMEELVRRTKATAILRILDRDELVAIAIVESSEIVRVSYPVGTRNPFYYGSSGKVLTAYLPETVRRQWFSKARIAKFKGRNTIKSQTFEKELVRVRRHGYAFSNESVSGIRSIAVPIVNGNGDVFAALGLGLPKHLFPLKRLPQLVRESKRAGQEISTVLRDREQLPSNKLKSESIQVGR